MIPGAGQVMGRLISQQLGSTSSCATALPLPYVLPPPGFTTRSMSLFCQFRNSHISLLGPFTRTVGGGLLVPHHHLGTLALFLCVPSLFILGPTLNPFKERSTGKCYDFPNPIIWNLGPPCSGTSQCPGDWRDQGVEGPTSERLNNLWPEVFDHGCPPILMPLIVTIAGHIAEASAYCNTVHSCQFSSLWVSWLTL